MLSYLSSIFNSFFHKGDEDDDDNEECFLAEQLLELEALQNQNVNHATVNEAPDIPRNVACFQRTGVITFMDESQTYILIDGVLYYDMTACSIYLNVNDKVLYLAYEDGNQSKVIVRILENYGRFWGETEEVEETKFDILEHVVIGEVDYREARYVFIKDSDLKFNLDNVEATFVPMKGDWLELKCTVKWDSDKPTDITSSQVLQVISVKPLRRKIKNATVTEWCNDYGICDRQIYVEKQSVQNGLELHVGAKVIVEAIESNQGTCPWRALKIMLIEFNDTLKETINKEGDNSLFMERDRGIEVTYPLEFEVDIQKTAQLELIITNKSEHYHIINKWIVLSKKKDSQINIKPFITQPFRLYPQKSFNMTITCHPKFLGKANECLIIMFKGFQVKRFIAINISNSYSTSQSINRVHNNFKSEGEKIEIMKNVRKKDDVFVPGIRPIKPPAFIPVRLGAFPIPERVWSAVLGDSDQTWCSSDYDKIITRIESSLPCLSNELNINNYIDKWHTLLYMEEIQANISMRSYDMPKVFLLRCQEYLGMEINGLSERRPSLIKGDRVLVTDPWRPNTPKYEGYIHCIKGDMILMKFNPQFHENYTGSDVSIEFHFLRTVYKRCHQAINLAISHLGPQILFPSRISVRSPSVPAEHLRTIKWHNINLNHGQKNAVINILKGEYRPMPYCIYGPPGTGKTVTVIETILQVLTYMPDCRILVATPSNSASNLITERLIQYRQVFSDSVIRLIAHHLLDSDNIPDVIKPFCATLDIAREETAESKYQVNREGINLNCRKSFVGRHRVTIGTCSCLGILAQMGLPKGHFTHVIVDEAGQATEPEIMIPMTFIDKENGQIILAGDPKQLGPVIMSKYCLEFEMDMSYFCRILETVPYQVDYESYENGFNEKLVVRLTDNYRSLQEVLTLPSEMFYDSSLVPKIDRNESWISSILKVISHVFDMDDDKNGGVFVYGIRGCNSRAEDSPSWYNPQEASMIALMTCKLYKKGIKADDLGIITPYIAQIKHLKLLFEAMGLLQPKIGTVEEFQGQEKPIILISTVRSTDSYLEEDRKYALGFVKNPKRLNVAITRAQVACILFCDPHLLSKDALWKKVIMYSVKEDKYMGCDLPNDCIIESGSK